MLTFLLQAILTLLFSTLLLLLSACSDSLWAQLKSHLSFETCFAHIADSFSKFLQPLIIYYQDTLVFTCFFGPLCASIEVMPPLGQGVPLILFQYVCVMLRLPQTALNKCWAISKLSGSLYCGVSYTLSVCPRKASLEIIMALKINSHLKLQKHNQTGQWHGNSSVVSH